jgi:hypothetical protein
MEHSAIGNLEDAILTPKAGQPAKLSEAKKLAYLLQVNPMIHFSSIL